MRFLVILLVFWCTPLFSQSAMELKHGLDSLQLLDNKLHRMIDSIKMALQQQYLAALNERDGVHARVKFDGTDLYSKADQWSETVARLRDFDWVKVLDFSINDEFYVVKYRQRPQPAYAKKSEIVTNGNDSLKSFLATRQQLFDQKLFFVTSLEAILFADSSVQSMATAILNKGDRVLISLNSHKWAFIRTDFQSGWMLLKDLTKSPTPKLSRHQLRRELFIQKNPTIGQRFKEAVLKGSIILGMTKDMVIASWDEPQKVNRSVGSWGVHEQWIYGDTYVYLENDIVKSWQE